MKKLFRTKYDMKKDLYTIEKRLQCDLWSFWTLYKEEVGYPGNGDFPMYFESEEGAANKILKLEIEQSPEDFPEMFI